jgi:hypothetical protein
MPPNKRRYVLQKITSRSAVPSLLKKSVANVGTPVAASTSIEKMGIS